MESAIENIDDELHKIYIGYYALENAYIRPLRYTDYLRDCGYIRKRILKVLKLCEYIYENMPKLSKLGEKLALRDRTMLWIEEGIRAFNKNKDAANEKYPFLNELLKRQDLFSNNQVIDSFNLLLLKHEFKNNYNVPDDWIPTIEDENRDENRDETNEVINTYNTDDIYDTLQNMTHSICICNYKMTNYDYMQFALRANNIIKSAESIEKYAKTALIKLDEEVYQHCKKTAKIDYIKRGLAAWRKDQPNLQNNFPFLFQNIIHDKPLITGLTINPIIEIWSQDESLDVSAAVSNRQSILAAIAANIPEWSVPNVTIKNYAKVYGDIDHVSEMFRNCTIDETMINDNRFELYKSD